MSKQMFKNNVTSPSNKSNILKVSEKNCYPSDKCVGIHCQHVCVVQKNNSIENILMNSEDIYKNLKDSAPIHIKQMYETA